MQSGPQSWRAVIWTKLSVDVLHSINNGSGEAMTTNTVNKIRGGLLLTYPSQLSTTNWLPIFVSCSHAVTTKQCVHVAVKPRGQQGRKVVSRLQHLRTANVI